MMRTQPTGQVQPVQQRKSRRILPQTLASLLLVPLIVILFLALQGQAATGEVLSESLRFNHSKHVAAEVNCVFCHPGVLNGPVATIPSVAKCVGCHRNVDVDGPEAQADIDLLMQLWDEGRPLRWEKVNDQPDFVYFSHRPHIAAGVSCESCHGNVSQMTMARPAYRLNMGFCLYCHRQQDPEKLERLTGCATCHK